jgi:hypothetical protein
MSSFFNQIIDRLQYAVEKFYFGIVNIFHWLYGIGNNYISSLVDTEDDYIEDIGDQVMVERRRDSSSLSAHDDVENDYIVLDSKKD